MRIACSSPGIRGVQTEAEHNPRGNTQPWGRTGDSYYYGILRRIESFQQSSQKTVSPINRLFNPWTARVWPNHCTSRESKPLI